jgi:hypothetical protein
VEDDTNPDSTPTVINTDGRLIVGYSSALTIAGITPPIQVQGSSNNTSAISSANWGTSATGQPQYLFLKSKSGTIGTQGIVASGDYLGQITWAGDDGVASIPASSIRSEVDGTPGVNDMPGRLIFNTTADGASSTTERMRIDSVGAVGIGATANVGSTLAIRKNITGATTSYGVLLFATISSDVTSTASMFQSFPSTQAAAFTLSGLNHFYANQNTIGATSAVTNQYGFNAETSLTGATNNYGFYSNIAAAANRWNFYAAGTAANLFSGVSQFSVGTAALPAITQISDLNTGFFFPAADTLGFTTGGSERMRIDSTGAVGIGGSPNTGVGVVNYTFGTTTTAYGTHTRSTIPATATSIANIFHTWLSTAANGGTPYTLAQVNHYNTQQVTINADSTITEQKGYVVSSGLTAATNNYGFHTGLAAAANRWNFYAAGTARNYMAADLTVNGATAIPAGGTAGAGLMVSTTANFGVFFGSGAPTLSAAKGSLYLRSDGSTVNDRMYVNTNGSTTWTSVVTSA